MAGLSNLLNTARDALTAQSYGLNVAGGNVANANTPGYVRRDAVLQTVALGTQTSGSVEVAGLRRLTDKYLDQRSYAASGQSSAASERDRQLAAVETLVSGASGGGIGDALNQLYSSFTSLAANPSDATARQTVLDKAETFASRARDAGDAIAQQKSDILTEAQGVAQQVNAHASEIAKLNQQIALAESTGQDAADLKDRRDQNLTELSSLIDTRTFTNAAGSLVVQVAGTTLVEGQTARTLAVDLGAGGNLRLQAVRPGGGLSSDITSFLTGGKLAGLREARDVDLAQVGAKLDTFVFDVGTAINGQHVAGFGLDGVSGRPLFAVSPTSAGAARALTVDSSVAGQPDRIAAAGDATSLPGGADNAVILGKLANKAFVFTNTSTSGEAYAAIVGDIGSRKAQSAGDVSLRADVKAQIDTMRESSSGVSLDEEMISLTKYQRAYEAASKVLKTADDLLQELMTSVGR
jgi:flagellar hook-associated protein 1 FlgK